MTWRRYLSGFLSKRSPPKAQVRPPRIELPSGSIPEQWRAWHALQPGGYAPVLLAHDPFAQWRPGFSHAPMVDSDLEHALILKYVQKDPELCEAFLDRALAIAERMRSEIEAWKHDGPLEQMRLDRGEAYARWIKTGALDRDMLRTAYGYAIVEATGELPYQDWDGDDYDPEGAEIANASVKEAALLHAARVALVAGDPALCHKALEHFNARGQSFHCQMRDALAAASRALAGQPAIDLDAARAQIADVLDLLRPVWPNIGPGEFYGARLAAFELAVILGRVDQPGTEPPNLDRVYAAIMAE
jgi:hypothetical protein